MDRLSSAPTDCRVPEGRTPDPTDAKADGNFGNHRAGYSPDKLANAEYWARKGGTLNAGEGLILCEEIDRLRGELRDAHTKVFHREEKLAWTERERDQLTSMPAERILAALRNPSDLMVDTLREQIYGLYSFEESLKAIRVALAAAEREVGA